MAFLYTQTHHYSSSSSPPPTANRSNFRFNQATESFSIAGQHTFANNPAMADETSTKDSSQWKADTSVGKSTEEKEKTPEKSTPVVPPPEKPLPGDCCGSGCVRCVWDVYYEELEDYNKLQKADS